VHKAKVEIGHVKYIRAREPGSREPSGACRHRRCLQEPSRFSVLLNRNLGISFFLLNGHQSVCRSRRCLQEPSHFRFLLNRNLGILFFCSMGTKVSAGAAGACRNLAVAFFAQQEPRNFVFLLNGNQSFCRCLQEPSRCVFCSTGT
jgi:hypothetical protein